MSRHTPKDNLGENTTAFAMGVGIGSLGSQPRGKPGDGDGNGGGDNEHVQHDTAATSPYMGKWDHLSQVWINRWTLLIFIVLARVVIESYGFEDDITDAKNKVLTACIKLEDLGSTVVSMPHYLSTGINEMTSQGIESVVNGFATTFALVIDGVKNVILFALDTWRSTWACLISALIQGAFDVAEEVVKGAADAAKLATVGVADTLIGIEDTVNAVIKVINDLPINKIAEVNMTNAIDTLQNVHINTTSAVQDILKVQAKVPTYSEIKDMANNLVGQPFNLAATAMTSKWGNYTFDRSLLPIAPKNTVNICSNSESIPRFFNGLARKLGLIRTYFIVICIILALIAIFYYAWREFQTWKRSGQTANMARAQAHDMFDASWIMAHPRLARFAFWLAEKITHNPGKQVLVRWFIAYATSAPALLVLSLALSEAAHTLIKLIVYAGIQREVPNLAAEIGGMAGTVIDTMNDASYFWANGTNSVISTLQSDLNNDLFSGVHVATRAVNDSLNAIIADISTVLHDTFGTGPFYNAISGVVNCTIVGKLEEVQKGLTFVSREAHLSFPTLPNGTFTIDHLAHGEARAFLQDPVQTAQNEMAAAVDIILQKMYHACMQQALIAVCLLLIYCFLVLMGVGRALWNAYTGVITTQPGGLAASFSPSTSSATHQWVLAPDGRFVMRGSAAAADVAAAAATADDDDVEHPRASYPNEGPSDEYNEKTDGEHQDPFNDRYGIQSQQPPAYPSAHQQRYGQDDHYEKYGSRH